VAGSTEPAACGASLRADVLESGCVSRFKCARALFHAGAEASREVVDWAMREGAVQRVRPKAMTVAVILAGLVPVIWGTGTGS